MSRGHVLTALATTAFLFLVAPAAARVATYGGTTNGDDPVVITAAGKQLRSMTLHWIADCPSGNVIPFAGTVRYAGKPPAGPPSLTQGRSDLYTTPLSKTGRFTGKIYGLLELAGAPNYRFGVSGFLSGQLKPSGGSGSYTVLVSVLDASGGGLVETCSATAKWKARRGRNVYAGSTSQGEPVVVTLNARRTRVSDIFVGYRLDCSDGTFIQRSEHFTFALARSGEFGAAFPDTRQLANGDTADLAYEIRGDIRAATARGRLYVEESDHDPQFQGPGRHCFSPTPFARWKAASG